MCASPYSPVLAATASSPALVATHLLAPRITEFPAVVPSRSEPKNTFRSPIASRTMHAMPCQAHLTGHVLFYSYMVSLYVFHTFCCLKIPLAVFFCFAWPSRSSLLSTFLFHLVGGQSTTMPALGPTSPLCLPLTSRPVPFYLTPSSTPSSGPVAG